MLLIRSNCKVSYYLQYVQFLEYFKETVPFWENLKTLINLRAKICYIILVIINNIEYYRLIVV